MEILLQILVAMIGAGATVLAAYIQRGRRESTYADAPVVNASASRSAPISPNTDELAVLFVFPGSRELRDVDKGWKQIDYSSIEMSLDGQHLDSGDGARGFQVEASGRVGLHDLVFQWEATTTTDTREAERLLARASGRPYDGSGSVDTRTKNFRQDMELVFAARGRCVVRLGFSNERFYIKSVEPRGAVFTPLPMGGIVALGAIGILMVVGSVAWLFAG